MGFRDLSCDLAGGPLYTKWTLDVRSLGHRDAIARDSVSCTHPNMYFKIQHTIMCLSIASILIVTSCFVCRVEVEPEQEATPFAEDPEPEPRRQGKETPIDHVDKIPLPSHVSLMHCIG